LRIDTYRAMRVQHINKTDSAVRITTFQPASSLNAEGRSQHRLKAR
jgi:protein subunit release factor A